MKSAEKRLQEKKHGLQLAPEWLRGWLHKVAQEMRGVCKRQIAVFFTVRRGHACSRSGRLHSWLHIVNWLHNSRQSSLPSWQQRLPQTSLRNCQPAASVRSSKAAQPEELTSSVPPSTLNDVDRGL